MSISFNIYKAGKEINSSSRECNSRKRFLFSFFKNLKHYEVLSKTTCTNVTNYIKINFQIHDQHSIQFSPLLHIHTHRFQCVFHYSDFVWKIMIRFEFFLVSALQIQLLFGKRDQSKMGSKANDNGRWNNSMEFWLTY